VSKPGVAIQKDVDKTSTPNGQPVTFTICVQNHTSGPINVQTATDQLQPATGGAWGVSSCGGQGPGGASIPCSSSSPFFDTADWTINITLQVGESVELTMTGQFAGVPPGPTPICNQSYSIVVDGAPKTGTTNACVTISP
jgi:uncharacterized repeat protein (TIGR01451 family)